MNNAGRFRRSQHFCRACGVKRKRLFAQNVLAMRDGFDRDLVVQVIRSGVDYRVDVFAGQHFTVVGGDRRNAGFFSFLQVGIAHGRDFDVGTEAESRNMNPQRGTARADDADA